LTALSHRQEEHLEEGERSSYDQAVVNIHTPRVVVEVEEDEVEVEAGTEADTEEETED